MKPEHISNFSAMVSEHSEHQPLSQLCQKNCGNGRTDAWGEVSTGSGDVSKRQLEMLWMYMGRATARRGRGLGTGSRCSGVVVWLREGRRLKLYKCLSPARQQEVTQNGRGGGAGTLYWQKHWRETGPGQKFKPFLQAVWRLIHVTPRGTTVGTPSAAVS